MFNTITLIGLISFSLLFNILSSSHGSNLIKSYSLNQFNYFESDVLPFTSLRKVTKDLPQSIWLVSPRPHVKYKRAVYLYIPGSFNYSNPGQPCTEFLPKLEVVSHYLPLCRGYYNLFMFRCLMCYTPPQWLEVYEDFCIRVILAVHVKVLMTV